jgi:hypothetical protein
MPRSDDESDAATEAATDAATDDANEDAPARRIDAVTRALTLALLVLLTALPLSEARAGGGVGGDSPLTPSEGALGTLITIDGEVAAVSFGEDAGKVHLLDGKGKRRHALQVESWSDTLITARVHRAKLGGWTVQVRRKGEKDGALTMFGGFELKPFAPTAEDRVVGVPGQEVVIEGLHLGDRKGRVKVLGRRAKVTRWEVAAGGDDPGAPTDVLAFLVPKGLSDNLYDLELRTPAGRFTVPLALEVVDSPVADMRDEVSATLDGKRFRIRGFRAFRTFVNSEDCLGEPGAWCLLAVGSKGPKHGLALAVPDYFAPTDGPVVCPPDSCLVQFQKGKGLWTGFADAETWKATPGGQVSGRFSALLTRTQGTKGPETMVVENGRFYDLD